MSYHELSVEERAAIQIGHIQGLSQRRIARLIERSPSTINRELRRNREVCGRYSARTAQQQSKPAAKRVLRYESCCQVLVTGLIGGNPVNSWGGPASLEL